MLRLSRYLLERVPAAAGISSITIMHPRTVQPLLLSNFVPLPRRLSNLKHLPLSLVTCTQFRLMENEKFERERDRMKRSRQQRKLLEMLGREKEQLQQQLSYVHEGPHARRERQLEQKMRRLNEDIETNQKLLDIEKTNLWELEGHIRKLQKEIDRLRANQVTDSRYKDNILKMQKDVVKLENRLEVANKKAGVVMAENADLRQVIDHMLQERCVGPFDFD